MINRFSRFILGLDIRSDTVSAVLIKSGLKGFSIEKTARAAFVGTGENGEDLSAALSKISAEINTPGALCIASLPFTHLSLRSLDVPFKDIKKIRQILPFELEPALPLPMDQQIIDFILSKTDDRRKTDTREDTSSLLISVIEQEELKYYLDHLNQAGLDPETVTIHGHATAMALAHINQEEDFILVDIGLKKIMVYMADKGQIEFIRSFPVPSNATKKTVLAANQMRHTLLAYQEHFPQTPVPDTLYVTGRGADDPAMLRMFKEELDLPATPLDFLEHAGLFLDRDAGISWKAHEMSNPMALAYCDVMGIKGFNFRKGPFANKKFWTDHKTDFIKSGVLAGLVVLMFFLGGFINTYLLERRIDEIQNHMNAVFEVTFPDKKLTSAPLEQMKAEIKAQKSSSLFSEDTQTNIRTIDLLNELSRTIPDQIEAKFTKLVYNTGSAIVSGNTDTFNSVDDMKNRLEKSDLFTAVTISSANMERSGNRVEFKLKMDLS